MTDTELQAQYVATVEATTGFITKTAIILPLLLLAISQPLLEFDAENKRVKAAQAALKREETDLIDGLKTQIRALESVPGNYAALVAELPAPPESLETLDTEPAAIAELDRKLRVARNNARKAVESAPKEKGAARPLASRSELQKAFEADAGVVQKLEGYIRGYRALFTLRKRAARSELDTTSVRVEKGTIPTPFGDFQLDPWLGLVVLALAGVVTYVYFHTRLRQLSALSAAWNSSRRPGPISAWPPPVWAYPLDPAMREACELTNGRRIGRTVLSLALHAAWIASIVLMYAGTRVWSASDSLSLPGLPVVVGMLIAAGTAFAVVLAVQRVAGGRSRPRILKSVNQSRRRLLIGAGGVAGFLAASAIAVSFYVRERLPRRRRTGPAVDADIAGALIVHATSGAAHHPVVCAGHLPRKPEPRTSASGMNDIHLHGPRAVAILHACGKDLLKAGNWLAAERSWLRAIHDAPESPHLYDELVRVYGRRKEYEKILPLLNRGLEQAKIKRHASAAKLFEARITTVAKRQKAAGARRATNSA